MTEFAILPGVAPMEAKLVAELPVGAGWQYEPKWDGFRCLAFRDGDEIEIMSKSGKSLARFFPEVVAMLGRLTADRFVLDGELIIPLGDVLAFAALQARLHPAESRILQLSAETRAQFMLFDCLAIDTSAVAEEPLAKRRPALDRLHSKETASDLLLSPCTHDAEVARDWLDRSGGALDGVVAKRLDEPYRYGERAMLKVEQHRSADCVVGGFRYDRQGKYVASLLLGLYGDDGRLNHVGFTSAIAAADRPALTKRLEALVEAPGFTGKAPGGPSRWSTDRSSDWQPLKSELVVEVLYDQVTAERFRHGTRVLRWRPDKAPRQCGLEQLVHEVRPSDLRQMIA